MLSSDVTQLLRSWRDGNKQALDELLPLVYSELRGLAERALRHERPGHTLQSTALVHEAYLRLVQQENAEWQNRAHFFAMAARMIRRILVDHARAHIEQTYRRPLPDRLIRAVLAFVLPHPARFRAALKLARLGRPFAGLMDKVPALKPLAAMLKLAPPAVPAASATSAPGVHGAKGAKRRGRVALLTGCAQSVLEPGINEATVSLLTRLGVEVVVARGEGCCGALVHHMGREEEALSFARRNVDAWTREIEQGGLDAIVITASGCGTTIKDYGYMLRLDPAYSQKAARVSALAKDITEYLAALDLPEPVRRPGTVVAYHSACSMQHGQKIVRQPKELLSRAGFVVKEPREGHLCCGSAGTYNILQPEISAQLRDRKVRNIEATGAEIVATGNIGCITQIASAANLPVVHTVRLLDWAYGGARPQGVPEARAPATLPPA